MHDDEDTRESGTALKRSDDLSTVPESDAARVEGELTELPPTREVEAPKTGGEALPVIDVMAEAPSLVFTVTSEPKPVDGIDVSLDDPSGEFALDEPSEEIPLEVSAEPDPTTPIAAFDWEPAPTRPLPLPPSPPAAEPAWDGQLPLRELDAPAPAPDPGLSVAGVGSLLGLLLVASAGVLFLLVGAAPGTTDEVMLLYQAPGSVEGAAALAPPVFLACAAALGAGLLLLGLTVPLLTIRSSLVAWCVATAVMVILVGAGLVGWQSRGPVAAWPAPNVEHGP